MGPMGLIRLIRLIGPIGLINLISPLASLGHSYFFDFFTEALGCLILSLVVLARLRTQRNPI